MAWLPDEAAALIGDAVMGRGIPLVRGGLMYPPMYAPPAAYLGSAATAFLAGISSAFWRIRSAKRGI